MVASSFQQMLYRALGAIVCALFAIQAIWIFMNPPPVNVWKVCHWIGEALLCLLAGAAGCFLEYKGGQALTEAQPAKFTANRVLLGVFYFWLGCYVMDISSHGSTQEILAHVTGVLAWVVSAGNFVIACACGGAGGKDGPEGSAQQSAQPPLSTPPPLSSQALAADSTGAGNAGIGAAKL